MKSPFFHGRDGGSRKIPKFLPVWSEIVGPCYHTPMNDMLARFVRSFIRAIRLEMDAMKARLGSFEVAVVRGKAVPRTTADYPYGFDIPSPNEKLLPGIECTLRIERREYLVRIERIAQKSLVLVSSSPLPSQAVEGVLVIYPWFLYERLIASIENLERNGDAERIRRALAVFGKFPFRILDDGGTCTVPDLNDSQKNAVLGALRHDIFFTWGPPGTGKTFTVARMIRALVENGFRVLVVSTTNAAVDRVLEKLYDFAELAPLFSEGKIFREGKNETGIPGTTADEIARIINTEPLTRIRELKSRKKALSESSFALSRILAEVNDDGDQLNLFSVPVLPARSMETVANLIPDATASLPPGRLRGVMERTIREQETEDLRISGEIDSLEEGILSDYRKIREHASIVLTTMAHLYVSREASHSDFDALIIEEAGMAVLPAVFYCATLPKSRVVLVGDPMQLPPIVQSDDPYVRAAMGRNIFSVALADRKPDSELPANCVMLGIQYRMHPDIGNLVSTLFYGGKLSNGISSGNRIAVTNAPPFPGHALVLIDTCGKTLCERKEGSSSRINVRNARIAASIAREAAGNGGTTVSVITPYADQAREIAALTGPSGTGAGRIECSTVHRFQGHESDVVILDLPDTLPMPPGILVSGDEYGEAANLLNVSISRAKGKLVVIADIAYYERHPSCVILSAIFSGISERRIWSWE